MAAMPSTRMTLVVILTVRRDALDAFHAFERRAAAIMARYGGAIERTVAIAPEGATVKEVHLVTFPDARSFEAYRKDDDLAAIAHLRQASVIAAEILIGEDGPDYGAGG